MPILSLSSSWNSHRHQDGHAMLREMADLGFTHAELSHGIRITLVPGILKAVEEGTIELSPRIDQEGVKRSKARVEALLRR